ncbi:hypothetical protein ANCCEY_05950 [Ancylostoma ceylanicum]|uniref:Uncharacterized protein n=1 Tax=Ancylostoma ceylanicum TaxID=53326 RepID=A0A0D6LSX7_9BILA|nr:hypothetical protein ANCCEY_05950 [Ancylostoma ceylanicum]
MTKCASLPPTLCRRIAAAAADRLLFADSLSRLVIAVRNGFPKGPGGLKQSPSPLQSPLSTDSSPSPVVPFQSLLEDRTRKLSPSELPSERGIITFTLSYDPVSLALQDIYHISLHR